MHKEMFHTTNLKAATALVTMGFELLNPPVTRTVREDGVESTVFWFEPKNSDGVRAIDVFRGMTKGSAELIQKDPENPINYMRVALQNRDELIGLIRSTPRNVVITRNGRAIAIREDATKEQRDSFKPFL
jgi:hypothetical protein